MMAWSTSQFWTAARHADRSAGGPVVVMVERIVSWEFRSEWPSGSHLHIGNNAPDRFPANDVVGIHESPRRCLWYLSPGARDSLSSLLAP